MDAQLQLVAGQSFDSKEYADNTNAILINETAVKQIGMDEPDQQQPEDAAVVDAADAASRALDRQAGQPQDLSVRGEIG